MVESRQFFLAFRHALEVLQVRYPVTYFKGTVSRDGFGF
jgi:hypothetical protein